METTAAVLWERRTPWSVETVQLDGPKEHEVLIRLAASGLCHSDDHAVTGDMPFPLPVVGGHEGSGIVEEIGPGITHLRPGDHVVLSLIPVCGRCKYCSTGRQTLCEYMKNLSDGWAISDGTPRYHARGQDVRAIASLGTFSEYVTVHQSQVIKIDSNIPLQAAALIGCGVTTGWGSAVYLAECRPGDTLVVVGAGGLGLSAIQGAHLAGAVHVVAVDPVELKRDKALSLGATHAVASMDEAHALVEDITHGDMADSAVLTVGLSTGAMIQPLLNIVGRGGRVVVASITAHSETSVPMSLTHLTTTQKQLRGSVFGGANPLVDIPRLLDLYQAGKLKLDEMLTRTYSLAEVNEGYADLLAGRNIRGVLTYA